MYGYVFHANKQVKFPYKLEGNTLTIYVERKIDINPKVVCDAKINSSNKYVLGNSIDSGKTYIFFVDKMPFTEKLYSFTTVSVSVLYYIQLDVVFKEFWIDKINFKFPELNVFYPLEKGLNNEWYKNDDIYDLKTVPYKETKENFTFFQNGSKVNIELGVSKKINCDSENPLSLFSLLGCEFEKTNNIDNLIRLYYTIKNFFQFICNRKNICINQFSILSTLGDRRYTIGDVHILFDESQLEKNGIIGQTIEYRILKSNISKFIQAFSDDDIYLEHIPENNKDAHNITIARFILDCAAFEWSFLKCYGDMEISQYRQDVKKDVLNFLEEIPDKYSYNSRKKGELKLYSKIIERVDRKLSEKLLIALKDFDDVLNVFIKSIFNANKKNFRKNEYSFISNSIESRRNAYAHGNIKKEMDLSFISDTIILEWLNYCMVLKKVGYTKNEIFNIINAIFDRRRDERVI